MAGGIREYGKRVFAKDSAIEVTSDSSLTINGVDMAPPTHAWSAATAFASGTAVTNTDTFNKVYSVATATAGSAKIELIDPASTAHTLVNGLITRAVDLLSVVVPPGWGVKITLTTSTGGADWLIY
jgi:hypothetical protein